MGVSEKDLKEVASAVTAIVPAYPSGPEKGVMVMSRSGEIVETRGMTDTVIWLKACSWSNRAIARHLGISSKTVDRFCKRSDFASMVEATAMDVSARIQDAARLRTLNVMVEALETKVGIMRDKRANPYLRDKIATDLITWAKDYLRDGRGFGSDPAPIRAMLELVKKIKGEDGSVTETRARIEGAPEAVAAAAGLSGRADEPGRSGEGARTDDSAGSAGGSERAS